MSGSRLCPLLSHFLPTPFANAGDDDSFPVVALERDTESTEGKAVLSTGKGLAKNISHSWL